MAQDAHKAHKSPHDLRSQRLMYAHLIQPAQRSKHLRADPCRFKRAHHSACAGKILPCAGSGSGQARPIPLCHGILVRHGRTWRHVHGRSAALSQHPRIGRDLPFTFWQFAHIINHIGKGGTCRLRLSKNHGRYRERRSPPDVQSRPAACAVGAQDIFASGNSISQSENIFLAVSAPGNPRVFQQ